MVNNLKLVVHAILTEFSGNGLLEKARFRQERIKKQKQNAHYLRCKCTNKYKNTPPRSIMYVNKGDFSALFLLLEHFAAIFDRDRKKKARETGLQKKQGRIVYSRQRIAAMEHSIRHTPGAGNTPLLVKTETAEGTRWISPPTLYQ